MITVVVLALILAGTAHAKRAHVRPVQERISWLQHRLAHHQYVCNKGKRATQRFACKAKVWTARELAEARAEWEWNWQLWLPAKAQRVGACETGYGKRPGRFDWDSGTYVSFAGIYRPAYNQFARRLGLPEWDAPGRRSPWEQWKVAEAIQQRYSWSAWGCGGA